MRPESKLERSARFWMRAYPRRWRAIFGDDLVAVLHDVTEPGAQQVSLREAAQVVRAGWALRWREHPPFWRWLAYRSFGLRLPDEYRFWVMDDLLGKFYSVRYGMLPVPAMYAAAYLASFLAPLGLEGLRPPASAIPFLVIMLAVVLGMLVVGRRFRARQDWQKFISPHVPLELLPRRERRRLARN